MSDLNGRTEDGSPGLLGILRRLRRARGKPSLKLCPRCGKPSIGLSSALDGWLTPEKYVCPSCGYRGPVVLELEEG